VDENGKNLPDAFAAEMKLYKLCKITIDGTDDPNKVAKNVTDALAKWAGDEAAGKTKLAKAEADAETELKKKEKANRKNAEEKLAKEDQRHQDQERAITNSGADAGTKAAERRKEDALHRDNSTNIYKEENEANAKAAGAKKDAVDKARGALPQAPKLDVTCAPGADCGKVDCEKTTIRPDPADDK